MRKTNNIKKGLFIKHWNDEFFALYYGLCSQSNS